MSEDAMSHFKDNPGNLPEGPREHKLRLAREAAAQEPGKSKTLLTQAVEFAEPQEILQAQATPTARAATTRRESEPLKKVKFKLGAAWIKIPVLAFEFSEDRDAVVISFPPDVGFEISSDTNISVELEDGEVVELKYSDVRLRFSCLPGSLYLFLTVSR